MQNQDDSWLYDPRHCANSEHYINGTARDCPSKPTIPCDICELVEYCSEDCKGQHATLHSQICSPEKINEPFLPDWILENRQPSWNNGAVPLLRKETTSYLWGNMPAVNLLRSPDTSQFIHRDLNLLFAASGDLRNIVETVIGLPDNYDGKCTIILNDIDSKLVARNIILLLIATEFSPEEAAVYMVHFWYSAYIPDVMRLKLKAAFYKHFEDLDIQFRAVTHLKLDLKGPMTLRIFVSETCVKQMRYILGMSPKESLSSARNLRDTVVLSPDRKDERDKCLFRQSTGLRLATLRFRTDGLLLPYAASRDAFNVPNPSFFDFTAQKYEVRHESDPLHGWSFRETSEYATNPANDVYGRLFYFLKNKFIRFANSVRTQNLEIIVLNEDATNLLMFLNAPRYRGLLFDRIELSNIADEQYIGPFSSLVSYSPFLKPKLEAPDATLLLLFMTSILEEAWETNDHVADRKREYKKASDRFLTYLDNAPVDHPIKKADTNSEYWRPLLAFYRAELVDYEVFFNHFVERKDMQVLAKRHGVRMREAHQIVDKWPFSLRLEMTAEEYWAPTVERFLGGQCYVEYERAS